ncbi:MAG: MotA/TolQ/ExbB proton channel family protein [Bacteroidales bacterium]|jgi:hypothetical protein|nr:MotA/TolQ/ExbB proton channel family protein [Bacteroidales bacterium]
MRCIIEKLSDGGPFFTYVILISIFVIIGLLVKAFVQKDDNMKTVSLVASFGWFALAWGYLGRTFGLILAFDTIAAAGDISPSMMAGGLKMALIGPLMGLSAFIIARIGIIVLKFLEKKAE